MTPETAAPQRYAIAGLIAMAAAMGIGRFVYTPILPGMMEGLSMSVSDAGLIASANYLGYLVGALLAAGGWAHGMDRRLMLAGLAVNCLLLAWMGLADTLPVFLVLRFLAGVASAFVMIFMSSIVFSRLALTGRSDLQALHFGGVGGGIAISALLTGGLYLADAGWRAGWLGAAVISLVAFSVVYLLATGGPAPAGGGAAATREPGLPRSGALTRLILAYGFFGAGYIVTATFLVAIVRQGGEGPLFESTVWLVTGLAGAPSVWLWGKVVRRIGLTATFAVGCLVEAAGVLASVAISGPSGPVIGGILLGGTFIAITAYGLQAARQLAAAAPRRVFALMTASFGTGQIVGPILAGYGAVWSGSFAAPSAGAALALAAAAAIAWTGRRAPR
ncbi:YbfB/YjiJ family MFS transporter [Aquibium sp. ELW1220]|uniref:YbfB/YjiJ family MFS transporter n=1 Tax=Aquibium sp. ELW1220 TaxID=2976766 RepID=UPI0025AFF91C|nr:YbfB/YjiJ family MFS transporter [Aquibium sp. ELW1220]MDN2582296.1 YbfB/YjiJ family MFS transporter [Aquibium sp. ELW1220]